MKLTKDAVKHVAKLASLPLSTEEEELYSEQLSKIIDYIDQLEKVDTSNVEPTYNVSGSFDKLRTSNVMREDKVGESLSQEEALQNGPNVKDGFFVTKGVFEDE